MTKVIEQKKVAINEFTKEMLPSNVTDTSKTIRYLNSIGYTTSEIEKLLKVIEVKTKNGDPIRYQHVRNVLNTNIKG